MYVIRKSTITLTAVLLASVLTLCFGFAAFSSAKASAPAPFTVVLDAGHGGVDPGVLGVNTKIKESDINLAIVKLLRARFAEAGFRVVLTRKNEGGLYGAATAGYKRRDMQKRRDVIRNSSPSAVISVHQNNFISDRSRRGGQVFFKPNDAQSRNLSEHIQRELNRLSKKNLQPLRGDYYVLNCSSFPSVIVECGFLSNSEDEALLCSEAYRERVADAVFYGTLSYFS